MSEDLEWDAIVIGGGLAGSATATKLAQQGRRVLLLEKELAAHDKVCGEFISIEAQFYLAKLGLDLNALGAKPINHIRLARGNTTAETKLPFQALSLSRRRLDEAMLSLASAHGAIIKRGTTVTDIVQTTSRWRVELADREYIYSDAVFLATGKHELRGWQRIGGLQNDFIGFKMHFKLTPQQNDKLAERVEMVMFNGGYAGLEPIEDSKANLCLVATKSTFARNEKNWDTLLSAILRTTPSLAELLANADPCWSKPLAIYGIPYGFVYRDELNAPSGFYRLGDQMAVIPSFSGDGMAIALHSAFLAVESFFKSDALSYHQRMRTELLPQIRRASMLSNMVRFSFAQKCIVAACRHEPRLLEMIAATTRIKGAYNQHWHA